MTTNEAAMRQALEALLIEQAAIAHEHLGEAPHIDAAIEALRSALAQPDTWIDDGGWEFPIEKSAPQAQQPLTIEEVEQIIQQHNYELHGDRARYIVRMTEQAHGIGEKPNIKTQIVKDISPRDCSTCKNCTQNGGISSYDADCFECSQYYADHWEPRA